MSLLQQPSIFQTTTTYNTIIPLQDLDDPNLSNTTRKQRELAALLKSSSLSQPYESRYNALHQHPSTLSKQDIPIQVPALASTTLPHHHGILTALQLPLRLPRPQTSRRTILHPLSKTPQTVHNVHNLQPLRPSPPPNLVSTRRHQRSWSRILPLWSLTQHRQRLPSIRFHGRRKTRQKARTQTQEPDQR